MRATIANVTIDRRLFNLTNFICQVAWQRNTSQDTLAASPDTSAARARHDSALFLPGVSSSLLAFIVFGTTTPFRRHMRRVFWDSWRLRGDDRAGTSHHYGGSTGSRKINSSSGYSDKNHDANTISTASSAPPLLPPPAATKKKGRQQWPRRARYPLPDHSATWTKTQAPAYEVTISGPHGGTRSVVVHGDGGGGGGSGSVVAVITEDEEADLGVRGAGSRPHSGLRTSAYIR